MESPFSGGTRQKLEILESDRPRSKVPFIVLGTIIGLLVIAIGVLSFIVVQKSKKTEPIVTDDLCVTPYCVKAANYLLESIDETVKPCEDFYHFVCGTWLKNTRIPDDSGAATTFNVLRTQLDYNVVDILSTPPASGINEPQAVVNARRLYQSCLDENHIETEDVGPIMSLVNNELGGWPILQGSSWDASKFDLMNLLLKLREYSNNIIFAMGTSTDEKNSTVYDIELGQSDVGLGQKQYYANESKITAAYRQLIGDFARTLSNEVLPIDQDVQEIFNFESEIAKHLWTSAEQRARQNETVRTTIGKLSEVLTTSFDFTNYLTRAYARANVTLVNEDIVAVDEIDYLYNVSSLVDRTPPRVLQNYIVWRFLMNRMDEMPKRFRILREKFDRIFRGTAAERPRTTVCGTFANGNMGFAVSRLYLKQYFDQQARNLSFELIANIRGAFIDMLKESSWMDEVSKNRAIEKAQAIDEKIGYPDYIMSDDVTQLEQQYAHYIFDNSYIGNILKLLQIKAKERFETLRKPVNRKSWGSSAPTVVNAFYTPSKNQITFPAGILQMPFFDKDAPKYLNYGGIGVVIGHEITHGFDDNGRQFDKDGNRIAWWTDETINKFIERKSCMVEQYSNFTVPGLNMTANGNQTQGEDIADNGGIRESFFAYQKWAKANPNADKKLPGLSKYSSEQMFFINYAHTWCAKMTDSYQRNRILSDVHSLGPFRVMGPTSNFVEFDRVFGCTPGQGNSRVKKCVVW